MMIKSFLKGTNSIIIAGLIILNLTSVKAQMHCRSILGGYLTPLNKEGSLLGAIEGTMAPGVMVNSENNDKVTLNGGMLIGGLDFSISNKHSFYIEGGYKNWINSELAQHKTGFSRHLGIRQAFYDFKSNTDIKLGLHEMKLGNYYLIDERVVGTSVDHKAGAFTFNFRAGTVLDNFARMGRFCGNKHLYSLITKDYTENIGESLGETNLAGFVLNWDPYHTDRKSGGNEFSEFGEFNNTNFNNDKKNPISNISLIVYDEFGEIIPNNKFYIGPLIDFNLPYKFNFQTGGVYQSMQNNNSVAYITKFDKQLNWGAGANTQLEVAYTGKYEIDDEALFQPLFSNLFLGEIMRLDAADLPLWQSSVKHNFPGKLNFHIALKAVGQTEGNKTSEIDLETGFNLFDHSQITAIFSKVSTNALTQDIYMARTEVRVAF